MALLCDLAVLVQRLQFLMWCTTAERILQSHVCRGDHCTAGCCRPPWWCPVQWSTTLLNSTMHRTDCSPFVMCLPCHIPSSEQRYLEADEKRDSILFSTEKFPNGTGCPKFQSCKVRNCNKLLIFLFLISSLRTLTKEKHLKITSHVLPNVIFRRLPSLSLTFFYLFSKFVWPSFLLFQYLTWQYFKMCKCSSQHRTLLLFM